MITWRAFPFILTTTAYLALGAWILVRRKTELQRLYAVLCLITALWQGIWAILLTAGASAWTYRALQVSYTGVVFLPAILYHFIAEFGAAEQDRRWVRVAYLLSVSMGIALWTSRVFVNGFYTFSWGPAAKAGILHPFFGILMVAIAARVIVLMKRIGSTGEATKNQQTQMVRWACYLYCGGTLDLLSNYGIALFPLSFVFCGIAVVFFANATLRLEFLAMALPRETEDERLRREAASAEMRRMGAAAAFPLVSQGELMGFLLLGEKMSEESYSQEDLLLLRIVANQAALAHQRVRYLELAVHGARTEMLGEIAGGFAHEIKTPLANISLPAELSLLDLEDLEAGRRTLPEVLPDLKTRLREIMQQVFKAGEKIEAVRQFSKPGQIQLSKVDLIHLLEETLGLMNHTLRKCHVVIRTQFPTALSPIRGDAKQLEIVFVNLFKNAAEAMLEHTSDALARELRIKGWEEGDWIVVSVKDSGPGIKKTHFGHLFEAYFTTKGSEGTGMGLFLSHQVVKAHGGSIDVKSVEGQGAEFIIRLPKYSTQEQPGKVAA